MLSISERIGYFFVCSDATQDECFERELFGGTAAYYERVEAIAPGAFAFLYNYQRGQMMALFLIISGLSLPSQAWEPEAWGGNYPCQVRFEQLEWFTPLSYSEAREVIPFRRNLPPAVIQRAQLEELLELFTNPSRSPKKEIDYRNENPGWILTKDGHRVRSKAEQQIDDWLWKHKILHTYETPLPIAESAFCDFQVVLPDGSNIFIEYWGRRDPQYKRRKKYKQQLYDQNGLPLIEIYPEDLKNLDEILGKLLNYFS